MRIRVGGPDGVTRPFVPNIGVAQDVEGQKADALDHIARSLSAIDHNLEALLVTSRAQTQALQRIAEMLPTLLRR